MLVLRRKVGERLVIAGVITVAVLAVEGERVKLGIGAPREMSIVREEVFQGPGKQRGMGTTNHLREGGKSPRISLDPEGHRS